MMHVSINFGVELEKSLDCRQEKEEEAVYEKKVAVSASDT